MISINIDVGCIRDNRGLGHAGCCDFFSRAYRQLKRMATTAGHIITFDWNRQGEGLLSQVSMFNDFNYKVSMCIRFSGLVHDLRTGHHFDLKSRTITKLTAVALP